MLDGENEMYNLFCKNLHTSLKKRINASIFVKIVDGDLYVNITKGRIEWGSCIPDVFKSLVNGYSVDNFVNYIVKNYRKEILGVYFY